ncbi:caspase family protein [Hwanghaeella sp.]|uniref:caspase family protein n=1 Tax=Hwanghaeella sp. TaxID=2605943 RepID=UPI003CCBC974
MATASHASPARLALVLGNGDYEFGRLKNPANDAALIAQSLRDVGFEVFEYLEADQRDMKRAIVNFGRELGEAGEDAVGLVYYAGHGVQFGGENYMIPVGAQIEDELDIDIEGIRASTLLTALDRAGNRLNIVILDACRNNPFAASSRSAAQGLARMDAPSGTLLAYSTSPGNVAVDGSGRNSPYTQALARAIREPGTKVEDVFKRVRIAVMERTNEKQVPWESSSLTGDFYFTEAAPEQPAAQSVVQPAPAPAAEPVGQSVEIEYWKSIANSNNPEMFRAYLAQFPDGVFSSIATQRIASLEQEQAARALSRQRNIEQQLWDEVKDSGDPALLQSFLAQYPDSIFRGLAEARIASLENKARNQGTTAGDQVEMVFWQSIKNSSDPADYQAYLARYPNGQFAAIAQNRAQQKAKAVQADASSSGANGGRSTTETNQVALAPGVSKFVGFVQTVDGLGNLGPTWCRGDKKMPIELVLEAGSVAGDIVLDDGQRIQVRGQVNAGRLIGKAIVNRGFNIRGSLTGGEMKGKIYNPFGSHSCGAKFLAKSVSAQ